MSSVGTPVYHTGSVFPCVVCQAIEFPEYVFDVAVIEKVRLHLSGVVVLKSAVIVGACIVVLVMLRHVLGTLRC